MRYVQHAIAVLIGKRRLRNLTMLKDLLTKIWYKNSNLLFATELIKAYVVLTKVTSKKFEESSKATGQYFVFLWRGGEVV